MIKTYIFYTHFLCVYAVRPKSSRKNLHPLFVGVERV